MSEKIAVIGLGYVGLPVAVALAAKYPDTVGFDISERRVAELRAGHDSTDEVDDDALRASGLRLTTDRADLKDRTFFIVTVPTPIDDHKQPDLSPVISATKTVGQALSRGACVVYESTVYPGVTEDICRPLLAKESGLTPGSDFTVGYSPERINPGDREHTLTRITKVVSGEDAATLERVAAVYGSIVEAGIHKAPTIKVAEAAKVIENTQRDLNIALMNELAIIFDRAGIRTKDVLAAAGTKWNFLRFTPGLVGGHCIGVDPYYLTSMAEMLGYHPQVILAGRRINDGMGAHVARTLVKMRIRSGMPIAGARVAVLGLTFKEDVPDIRNSRVPDIVAELRDHGIEPLVHDPMANAADVRHEYGLELAPWESISNIDGLVLAVNHRHYRDLGAAKLLQRVNAGGIVVDVKSMLDPADVPAGYHYWSL